MGVDSKVGVVHFRPMTSIVTQCDTQSIRVRNTENIKNTKISMELYFNWAE
jgi:hypothetical protein